MYGYYNIFTLLGIIILYMFLQSATQHKYSVFVIYIALINLYWNKMMIYLNIYKYSYWL